MTIPFWLKAGAVVAALLMLAGSYRFVYEQGRAAERQAMLERSVEILRERMEVDDKVGNMDDAALCRELGGLPDECAQLGM